MNAKYFKSLPLVPGTEQNHTLRQSGRFENPPPIVDFVFDEKLDISYIVDYAQNRYQQAAEGADYSDWIPFES